MAGILDSLKSTFPDAPWPGVMGSVTPAAVPVPGVTYSIKDHIAALGDGARVLSTYAVALPLNLYPPDVLQVRWYMRYTAELRVLLDGQVIEGPVTLRAGTSWTNSTQGTSEPKHPEWKGKSLIVEQVSPRGSPPRPRPGPEPTSYGYGGYEWR